MKKFVAGLVIGLLIASSAMVFADGQALKLIVNGEDITADAQPVVIDGKTLVPARALAEKLGANVTWDAANNAVVVTSSSVAVGGTPTDLPPVEAEQPKTEQMKWEEIKVEGVDAPVNSAIYLLTDTDLFLSTNAFTNILYTKNIYPHRNGDYFDIYHTNKSLSSVSIRDTDDIKENYDFIGKIKLHQKGDYQLFSLSEMNSLNLINFTWKINDSGTLIVTVN